MKLLLGFILGYIICSLRNSDDGDDGDDIIKCKQPTYKKPNIK